MVSEAIEKSFQFLSAKMNDNGLWEDFNTKAGRSEDWVSGFVLTALLEAGFYAEWMPDALQSLLAKQRKNGGWGYHSHIPEDADSTAWALRALISAQWLPPHTLRAAVHFLLLNEKENAGGFTTYRDLSRIGEVIGETNPSLMQGWGVPHVCVTSNVLLALMDAGLPGKAPVLRRGGNFLLKSREKDGLWLSYWWEGPLFSTYHTLLVLMRLNQLPSRDLKKCVEKIQQLKNDQAAWPMDPHGCLSPFATSLAVRISLLACPDNHQKMGIAKSIQWLLNQQREDGSWPSYPILRIPDARVKFPNEPTGSLVARAGTGIVVPDDCRIFSTAFITATLEKYRQIHIQS